jgi:hypothetical protein
VRVSSECVCRSVAGEERERGREMKGWVCVGSWHGSCVAPRLRRLCWGGEGTKVWCRKEVLEIGLGRRNGSERGLYVRHSSIKESVQYYRGSVVPKYDHILLPHSTVYISTFSTKTSIKLISADRERLPLIVQWASSTRLSVRRMPDQGHRFESGIKPKSQNLKIRLSFPLNRGVSFLWI